MQSSTATSLPALLSSFITPLVSLLAVYHTDIPSDSMKPSYGPSSLSLCSYLATTVITVHSLHHVLARKAARDRSVIEPSFGLDEETSGVIQGLGANSMNEVVLELEHRRKSGRGVKEWYVLANDNSSNDIRRRLCLLEDFPGYTTVSIVSEVAADASLSTFELGLTDKQRRDREGVVLPYFDAQKGSNEGGRILYDMGSEDDFDEEEDEI
ncbi:hypothetical protein AMS68_007331 [Peltaster fructicola]|uniref:Elongator complex protein 5 n=1 Tax=Peltaster fructicola TaxID=286661 RepID=A0A6H0Y473_9PEZI|nr:hypothetical protein AMS68_007331 [Peltaster fructicola]